MCMSKPKVTTVAATPAPAAAQAGASDLRIGGDADSTKRKRGATGRQALRIKSGGGDVA